MSAAAALERRSRDAGAVLTVRVPSVADAPARETLLTESIHGVIEFLARSGEAGDDVAIVDLQVDDAVPAAALPGVLAFLEATRGIVQAFVLETPPSGPAANVVISGTSQARARERTIEYLFSADGRFSRGASYDLRRDA